MSKWEPTMYLEWRDGILFQQWRMRNHHNELKLQWRAVKGQGPQPTGKLERFNQEDHDKKWEYSHEKWADVIVERTGFDPSD